MKVNTRTMTGSRRWLFPLEPLRGRWIRCVAFQHPKATPGPASSYFNDFDNKYGLQYDGCNAKEFSAIGCTGFQNFENAYVSTKKKATDGSVFQQRRELALLSAGMQLDD